MSECFKVFYVELYVHSLVDKSKWEGVSKKHEKYKGNKFTFSFLDRKEKCLYIFFFLFDVFKIKKL